VAPSARFVGPECGSCLPASDEAGGVGLAPAGGGLEVTEERWFIVDLEADSDPIETSLVEDLVDALDASDTLRSSALAAGGGARGVSVTTSVAARDIPTACGHAHRAFGALLEAAGIDHEIMAVRVMTEEAANAELDAQPDELAGVSEVAAVLGVSRQRVAELRGREGFPAPIAQLAAGPVWRVAMLQRFVDEWPRRPGRPRRAAG
jgi:hypothetical protein